MLDLKTQQHLDLQVLAQLVDDQTRRLVEIRGNDKTHGLLVVFEVEVIEYQV